MFPSGPATSAQIDAWSVSPNPGNNDVYIGSEASIRKVDGVTGVISTICGGRETGFSGRCLFSSGSLLLL